MSTRLTTMVERAVRAAFAAAALMLGVAAVARGQSASESPPVGLPAHGALEDPFNHSVLFDRLEAQDADGSDVQAWDVTAWLGRAYDKLTIRSEGERTSDTTERAELQLLWAHSVARWWDVVAGARADFQPSPTQSWAAFGIQGLAPYRFELEATAYVGEHGDSTARLEAEYELLITHRLILQPRVELNWYGQEDPDRGIGTGLANAETGLRLRYEFRREVAPYVGLVRERKFGGTEDFARAAGEDADDTRWVAGIRLRF
jgi:copper resistance protein B